MKRPLVLVLTATALLAGCGSSSSSSSGGGGSSGNGGGGSSVSSLFAASQAATKNATAAAFDLKMNLLLKGHLRTTSSAAALLNGPLNFELRGEAGHVAGGVGKFDINFTVNYTGGSFTGRILSPDGKTAYLQMPLLLGPSWQSIDISQIAKAGAGASGTGSSSQSLNQLKALGVDPSKWLKNVALSTSGSTDTVAADLDLAALFADVSKLSTTPMTAKTRATLSQIVAAVKTAHFTESFDHSSHLPSGASMHVAVTLPPSLRAQASGLNGFDFTLTLSLSKWNQDFTVHKPAGATPLNSALLGGGLAPAA
jgi:hypothetical protein